MEKRIIFVILLHHVHLLGINLSLNLHWIKSTGTLQFTHLHKYITLTLYTNFKSLFILHRNNIIEMNGPIKQPNRVKKVKSGSNIATYFLIYVEIQAWLYHHYFSVKTIALVSLAIIIVLTGVAFGVFFGLATLEPVKGSCFQSNNCLLYTSPSPRD